MPPYVAPRGKLGVVNELCTRTYSRLDIGNAHREETRVRLFMRESVIKANRRCQWSNTVREWSVRRAYTKLIGLKTAYSPAFFSPNFSLFKIIPSCIGPRINDTAFICPGACTSERLWRGLDAGLETRAHIIALRLRELPKNL